MKRAAWLVILACLVGPTFVTSLMACSKKEPEASAAQVGSGDRPADQPKAFANFSTLLDLWEHAHLAEIDHHGLYIELGTPARQKFTFGDWRSGWGKDGASGADVFSYANADSSRVYLQVDKS